MSFIIHRNKGTVEMSIPKLKALMYATYEGMREVYGLTISDQEKLDLEVMIDKIIDLKIKGDK